MADISNNQKNTIGIENVTSGNDLVVNSDGSVNTKTTIVSSDDVLDRTFLTDIVITVSTSEAPVILVRNPGGSGKSMRVKNLYLSVVTGGRYFLVKTYSLPTVTSTGTLQTSSSVRVKTSPPTASVLAYLNPTVSANGTRRRTFQTGQFVQTTPITEPFFLAMEPGFDLLLTAEASGNNSSLAVTIVWEEVTI